MTPEPTGPAQPGEALAGTMPLQEDIDGLADEIALGAPHLAAEGLESLAFLTGEIDLGSVHGSEAGVYIIHRHCILVLVPGCLSSSQLAQQAAQHDLQLGRCEGEPVWTADGEAELHKIPFFVRGKVRRNTETFARERGLAEISAETLCDAKAHFSR